jgi:hypothetical protein
VDKNCKFACFCYYVFEISSCLLSDVVGVHNSLLSLILSLSPADHIRDELMEGQHALSKAVNGSRSVKVRHVRSLNELRRLCAFAKHYAAAAEEMLRGVAEEDLPAAVERNADLETANKVDVPQETPCGDGGAHAQAALPERVAPPHRLRHVRSLTAADFLPGASIGDARKPVPSHILELYALVGETRPLWTEMGAQLDTVLEAVDATIMVYRTRQQDKIADTMQVRTNGVYTCVAYCQRFRFVVRVLECTLAYVLVCSVCWRYQRMLTSSRLLRLLRRQFTRRRRLQLTLNYSFNTFRIEFRRCSLFSRRFRCR